jgi:hypothetical protein
MRVVHGEVGLAQPLTAEGQKPVGHPNHQGTIGGPEAKRA